MRASHILVKHQGSRRTASWKDTEGVQIKTRTKVSYRALPHRPYSSVPTAGAHAYTSTRRSARQEPYSLSSLTSRKIHCRQKNPRRAPIAPQVHGSSLAHYTFRDQIRAKNIWPGVSLLQLVSCPVQREGVAARSASVLLSCGWPGGRSARSCESLLFLMARSLQHSSSNFTNDNTLVFFLHAQKKIYWETPTAKRDRN